MKIDKDRVFPAFASLLHIIATSGMPRKEVREWLVKSCKTDDIVVLLDVLDDLLINMGNRQMLENDEEWDDEDDYEEWDDEDEDEELWDDEDEE